MAFFRVEPPEKGRIYLIKNGVWQGYSTLTKYAGGHTITSNENDYCWLQGVTANNTNSSVVNYPFPAMAKRLIIKGAHIGVAQETGHGVGIATNTNVTSDFNQLSPAMVINSATDQDGSLDLTSISSDKYLYIINAGGTNPRLYIKDMYFEM